MTRRKPYGEHAAQHAAELTARTAAILHGSAGASRSPAPMGATLLMVLLALVALGLWADHSVARSAVNEVLTGIAVVGAAALAKAP